MPALKQSASVFPKVHSVWGRLWDDLGLSPTGQPRASLSAKRLKKLGEVRDYMAICSGPHPSDVTGTCQSLIFLDTSKQIRWFHLQSTMRATMVVFSYVRGR